MRYLSEVITQNTPLLDYVGGHDISSIPAAFSIIRTKKDQFDCLRKFILNRAISEVIRDQRSRSLARQTRENTGRDPSTISVVKASLTIMNCCRCSLTQFCKSMTSNNKTEVVLVSSDSAKGQSFTANWSEI